MSLKQTVSRNNHQYPSIRPRRLPANGTIAITSPATTPDATKLERGISYLESLGYRIVVGKSCTSKEEYLAGNDTLRAAELNDFFRDPGVDAIFCSRGGYGGMHLLPMIDYDAIRANPKLFCGFSDITALQWGIYAKCGLPSVSGAMVATDFGDLPMDPGMESQFWELIETGFTSISFDSIGTEKKSVPHGTLIAGTLAVAAKQMSSPFFPVLDNHIVVFEDVDEPIHKIEGYLRQLVLAGQLNHVEAIIFGEFTPPKNESFDEVPSLDKVLDRILSPLAIPYTRGIRYGHIKNKISLPVGVPISVSLGPVTQLRTTGSLYTF